MIKYISGQGPHLQVFSNSPSINNNYAVGVGQTRFNASLQQLEVYDGYSWINLTGTASVTLTDSANSAISWAIEKMEEEKKLKLLMEKHPGLKESYERFELMKALVAENENVDKT